MTNRMYTLLIMFMFVLFGFLNQFGVIDLTDEMVYSWTLSGLSFTISCCFIGKNKLFKFIFGGFQFIFFVFLIPIPILIGTKQTIIKELLDKIDLNTNSILLISIGFSILSIEMSKIEEEKKEKFIMETTIAKVMEIFEKRKIEMLEKKKKEKENTDGK